MMGLTRRQMLAGTASSGLCFASRASADQDDLITLARRWAASAPSPLVGLVPAGCEANLAPVIAEWREAVGADVELTIVDFDQIGERMMLDGLSRRSEYSFALPATFGVQDLAWSGVIRPLSPITDAFDTPLPPEEPSLYDHGDVIDGIRYGYQTDGDVYLLFCRKDLLDDPSEQEAYRERYGENLAFPRTWAELDRQMSYFSRPEKGEYGGLLFRDPQYAVWEFYSRLHAKGVLPFDQDLMPQIASNPAVEALADLIAASHWQHPEASTMGLLGNWRLFPEKQSYCTLGWGGSQKVFHAPGSDVRGQLEVGPLPGGVTPPAAHFNWGWSYVVPKRAPLPELGLLFSRFATSTKVSPLAVREPDGFFDPFRAEHYSDPHIKQAYGASFLTVHEAAMSSAIPDLYLPGHDSFYAQLANAIDAAMSDKLTPHEALSLAASKWQITSQDFENHRMVETWHELRRKYPSNVQKSLGI